MARRSQSLSTPAILCNSAISSFAVGAKSRPSSCNISPKPWKDELLAASILVKKPYIWRSDPLKTCAWASIVKGPDGSLIVGSVGQNGVIGKLQADAPRLAPRHPNVASAWRRVSVIIALSSATFCSTLIRGRRAVVRSKRPSF